MSVISKIVWEEDSEVSLNTSDVIYAQQINISAMLRKHVSTSPGSYLEIQHLGANNLSLNHFIMLIEITNTMNDGCLNPFTEKNKYCS